MSWTFHKHSKVSVTTDWVQIIMSSSDTWSQLQAHKRKHEDLKERLAKRRKERQGIFDSGNNTQEEKKPTGRLFSLKLIYFHSTKLGSFTNKTSFKKPNRLQRATSNIIDNSSNNNNSNHSCSIRVFSSEERWRGKQNQEKEADP